MSTAHIQGRVARIEVTNPAKTHILLIETKRLSGFTWEMPGGKVDEHETIKQAAGRELWEETGLRLPLVLVRYRQRAIPHDPTIFWEHYMFTGVYDGGVITLESPDANYRWSTAQEAYLDCPDWWSKHYLFSKL